MSSSLSNLRTAGESGVGRAFFQIPPEEGSLFLERAAWILDDGTPVEIDGSGILITRNLQIQSVSFMGPGVPIGNTTTLP
jgi:hypothetical protein